MTLMGRRGRGRGPRLLLTGTQQVQHLVAELHFRSSSTEQQQGQQRRRQQQCRCQVQPQYKLGLQASRQQVGLQRLCMQEQESELAAGPWLLLLEIMLLAFPLLLLLRMVVVAVL